MTAVVTADPQTDDESLPIPGRYICELTGPDVGTEGKRLLNLLQNQLSGYEVTMPRTFDYALFKAVTIQITRTSSDGSNDLLATISANKESLVVDALKIVAKTGMIAKVYPVHAFHKPKVMNSAAASEDINVSAIMPHHQTQVDRVHSELGNTGAGIKVGVIDSG